ncbi:hypothetical protein Glove_132g284 [Diversispora epigaea]|uniref:Uncharacterized protein n=1 Tax=Diversispora epigaea TaxID=1348612 RepID=A0A397J6B2_9GLOM|nr:hypothetical protein Glove_132g284 [Diversispora epigaea]
MYNPDQLFLTQDLSNAIQKIKHEKQIAGSDASYLLKLLLEQQKEEPMAFVQPLINNKSIKIIQKMGYKLDKERLIAINNNNKYNIPFRGRDKGSIARKVLSNKHQVKTIFSKCKQNENASSSKKKLKKTITIESDIEDNQNEDNQDQGNIEFQEKVMALKECQLKVAPVIMN